MPLRKSRRPTYEDRLKRARRQWGYAYLLHCPKTRWSKIGWTLGSPERRLEQVRAEFRNGFDWRLVAAGFCYDSPAVESALHRAFDCRRVTDKREWFVLDEHEREGLVRLLARTEDLREIANGDMSSLTHHVYVAECDAQDRHEEWRAEEERLAKLDAWMMSRERGY